MSPLIQPVITEKSMQLAPSGQYTFEVHPNTNKIEIAKEIKRLYKVDVVSVKIISTKGKYKIYKRIKGKQSDIKKAIIILKSGNKIPGFEMAKEKGEK
ncbi:MAG: 50S ribosomal protein L23 [bacterium]|nr:50S ribosomal protein L23 [bacterium]